MWQSTNDISTWFSSSIEPPTYASAGMAHHPKVHTSASCLCGFPGRWKSSFRGWNINKTPQDLSGISWPPCNSHHLVITVLGWKGSWGKPSLAQCYWNGGKHGTQAISLGARASLKGKRFWASKWFKTSNVCKAPTSMPSFWTSWKLCQFRKFERYIAKVDK